MLPAAPGEEIEFVPRDGDHSAFSFMTPWAVANVFRKDGCESLIAARVLTRNTSDGRMVCVSVGEGSTVHPYVEPPKAKGLSSLLSRLADVKEKKQKQSKRGKVSVGRVLPNPVVGLASALHKNVDNVPKQESEDESASAEEDDLHDLTPKADHFDSNFGPVRVLQVCGEDMPFQVSSGQVHWTVYHVNLLCLCCCGHV